MIPQTRKEVFYNAILNGGDTPTPVTREEMYLAEIAKNGSGGGGGGGSNVVVYAGTYDESFTEISIPASFNDVTAAMAQGKIVMVLVDASEEDAPNYEAKIITLAFYRDSTYYVYLSPANDAAANGGEAEMESATENIVFELGK